MKLYRDALDAAWEHDHRTVVGAARDRRQLRAMFRVAEFPVPEHLPDIVEIWRGTGGVTLDVARGGFSWSTNRDVACWFACECFLTPRHDPLVIRATVAKNDLYHPYNDRKECEVIHFAGGHAVADGDPTDWKLAASRWSTEIRAHNAAI